MRAVWLALVGCSASSSPTATPTRATTPATPTPALPATSKCGPEARAFDFLLGHWRGIERDPAGKTTATSIATNEVVLGGCALRETWQVDIDGRRAFDAIMLRSFDGGSKRWMLTYVDDGSRHQLYEAKLVGARWQFFRERKADDGSTVLVRITWQPEAARYAQTIERSTDAGTTWTLGGTITYERM